MCYKYIWFMTGPVACVCEYISETSRFLKREEFIDQQV
jgi:hypothetical protein